MPRAVEGWAGEVVHRRVDDHERRAVATALHADHPGQQHPGIAGDHPARLEGQPDIPSGSRTGNHRAVFGGGGQHLATAIRDTQSAAEIDVSDVMPRRAQVRDQHADLGEGGFQRFEVGQLAADVDRHPAQVQPGQRGQFGKGLAGAKQRYTELVLGLAGGDLGVGFRIDIGVYPEAGRSPLAARGGESGELAPFLARFDVELANPLVEPEREFGIGLADPGEHDLARLHACRQRAHQFAARDDIGAKALPLQHLEHGEVGVGLDREGDQRVPERRQRLAEHLRMALQGGSRIDIDRCADFRRDAGQRHVLGVHHAIDHPEMVHRAIPAASRTDRPRALRSGDAVRRCVRAQPAGSA